eukprot:CAMPEP_0183790104 /NCGR_PEP_ID=MMETSP0803_2-20130417/807_1 /TAXON_ID=195967 /ORGANISM="Crustomastix stigmata, Strain CCMP3273" /LENGTH=1199 /DNA_ID=CAMNT_0026034295 /DNA_START=693 /DNA_END=4289 /DNA_ORIENTATION=-
MEKTYATRFFIFLLQYLDFKTVQRALLPLFSLSLWRALPECRLHKELEKDKCLRKFWHQLLRKEGSGKKFGPPLLCHKAEVNFLPCVITKFFDVLQNSGRLENGCSVHNTVAAEYCFATLRFVIDLLAQLPTRRFVLAYIEETNILAKCQVSEIFLQESFQKSVNLLDYFMQNHTREKESRKDSGTPGRCKKLHERCSQIQLLAYKVSIAEPNPALRKVQHWSDVESLVKVISARIPDQQNVISLPVGRDASLQALAGELRTTLSDEIQSRVKMHKAFYTRCLETLDNVHSFDTDSYMAGDSFTAAKLGLRFLCQEDYLLRNFELLCLEACTDVSVYLHEVICRLQPRFGQDGSMELEGWSPMAAVIDKFYFHEIKRQKIGTSLPSTVTAEVQAIALSKQDQSSWEQIHKHDTVYLISISAPEPNSTKCLQCLGVRCIREAEVVEVTWQNKIPTGAHSHTRSPQTHVASSFTLVVSLTPSQYIRDLSVSELPGKSGTHSSYTLLIRRDSQASYCSSLLKAIQSVLSHVNVLPNWLHDTFLGNGDPRAAHWERQPSMLKSIVFQGTFSDEEHVNTCLGCSELDYNICTAISGEKLDVEIFVKRFARRLDDVKECPHSGSSQVQPLEKTKNIEIPQMKAKLRFTHNQIKAVWSGLQHGLTVIVGPPGSGKSDTATEILYNLFTNFPQEHTILIARSNAALNELFQKVVARGIPAEYLLRLGQGEATLQTDMSFTYQGRIQHMLARRLELLCKARKVALSLEMPARVPTSCETAKSLWNTVQACWEQYLMGVRANQSLKYAKNCFPLAKYVEMVTHKVFEPSDLASAMKMAFEVYKDVESVFSELHELRAYEVLKHNSHRNLHLLLSQAKVLAMTSTYAALKRDEFLSLKLKYQNVVFEESAQLLEVESFIALTLQSTPDTLKRVVLIGDDQQLPPVVKSLPLRMHAFFDQSLFVRLLRLTVPRIILDKQGRARPSIAQLFSFRYKCLTDLPCTKQGVYKFANPGFLYETQFIDVSGHNVKESEPCLHFYQNVTEAEYICSVFQYMRMLGYPSSKISILTTYRGQCALLNEIFLRRCKRHPMFGMPAFITTVDKYQGQQNDYILLSLVRTRARGHFSDDRRMCVAFSRARLGLYVFGNISLFTSHLARHPVSHELFPSNSKLALVPQEIFPATRPPKVRATCYFVSDARDLGKLINNAVNAW